MTRKHFWYNEGLLACTLKFSPASTPAKSVITAAVERWALLAGAQKDLPFVMLNGYALFRLLATLRAWARRTRHSRDPCICRLKALVKLPEKVTSGSIVPYPGVAESQDEFDAEELGGALHMTLQAATCQCPSDMLTRSVRQQSGCSVFAGLQLDLLPLRSRLRRFGLEPSWGSDLVQN